MSNDKSITEQDKDILFRKARTYNGWIDKDVPDALLQDVFDLMKWAPTSANCMPMRVKFVRSKEAKERLKPYLMEGNQEKTMKAPVVAILAYDMEFYEHLPRLFPHTDAKSWFVGDAQNILETANRNGTLQGGYFILAARALGLDCGPMSGFDQNGVKEEFFADDNVVVNFLCNLGYGDASTIFERSPRFDFDDVCEVV